MASQHAPAAGTNTGAPTKPTRTRAPDFLRYARPEIEALNKLQSPMAGWLYFILLQHCVFDTGEFLGTYARLIELATEPRPQQGPRAPGPTYEQLRRALRLLEGVGLVRRGEQNEAQGQLRLYIEPRRRSRA
jgi:hypothetical protein